MTHPIEVESYRRLRLRIDLSHLPPLSRAVTERVIHASADLAYADDLALDEDALEAGVAALRAGAPVLADVRMVATGIAGAKAALDWPVPDGEAEPTRTAAAMRAALAELPGAVVVVGCAPTALVEAIAHARRAPLIVGLPVGFVGAVEAKAALRNSGRPAISNRSEKGGSAVAAAAVNALARVAHG